MSTPMPEFDPEKWESFILDLSQFVSEEIEDKYMQYVEKHFLKGSGDDEPIDLPTDEAQ